MPRVNVFSAHSYQARMRFGTSYLAESLAARGWDVLYLEQPTSLLHLGSRRARPVAIQKVKDAWRRARRGEPHRIGPGNVTVHRCIVPWPYVNLPLFRSRAVLDHWWRATFPAISLSEMQGADATLFDSPFYFSLVRQLDAPSIYRYADRLEYFEANAGSLLGAQQDVFHNADIVAYTAKAMISDLASREKPILYLPNGVDLSVYQSALPEPSDLTDIPHPRVIYSGTIGPWFDMDTVLAAAQLLPTVQFIILGPLMKGVPVPQRPQNVHWLGLQDQSAVAGYLSHCDAAVIPFDVKTSARLVEAINPLKLYEYCAAGLPVVTYRSAETEAAGALVRYYSDVGEFVDQVRAALDDDQAGAGRARRAWAANASWDLRAITLEDAIADFKSSRPASV